jgi:hypothetical protein
MRRRLAMVTVGAWLVLLSAPLPAHHAFSAEFDGNSPVTLKGVGHQTRVGQSAFVVVPGRQRSGDRKGGALESRDGRA